MFVAYSKNEWTDFYDLYLKWREFQLRCASYAFERFDDKEIIQGIKTP